MTWRLLHAPTSTTLTKPKLHVTPHSFSPPCQFCHSGGKAMAHQGSPNSRRCHHHHTKTTKQQASRDRQQARFHHGAHKLPSHALMKFTTHGDVREMAPMYRQVRNAARARKGINAQLSIRAARPDVTHIQATYSKPATSGGLSAKVVDMPAATDPLRVQQLLDELPSASPPSPSNNMTWVNFVSIARVCLLIKQPNANGHCLGTSQLPYGE